MKNLSLIFFTFALMSSVTAQQTKPLKQFYSLERKDYFTTATEKGIGDATDAGYQFNADEGFLSNVSGSDKIELILFWNGVEADNAVATVSEKIEMERNGYTQIRSEGFIWRNGQAGRLALKLYYSASDKDYALVSSPDGESYLNGQGYRFVKSIGFVETSPREEVISPNTSSNTASNGNIKPVFSLPVSIRIPFEKKPTPENGVSINRGNSRSGTEERSVSGKSESAEDENGMYCYTEKMSATTASPESFLLGMTSNVFYPGAMYQVQDVLSGAFTPPIIARNSYNINSSLVSASSNGPLRSTLNEFTYGAYNEALRDLLVASRNVIPSAQVAVTTKEIFDFNQLKMFLGVFFSGYGSTLDANFAMKQTRKKHTFIGKFVQRYFDVNVDFNPNSPLTREQAPSDMAFVSTVGYGRIGIVKIETDMSLDSINAALNFRYSGNGSTVGINGGVALNKMMESSSFDALLIGGDPSVVQNTSFKSPEALHEALRNGGAFSANNTPVPISYQLRFLDGSVAMFGNSLEYTKRTCTPAQTLYLSLNAIGVKEASRDRVDNGDCLKGYGKIKVEVWELDKAGSSGTPIRQIFSYDSNNQPSNMVWELNNNNPPYYLLHPNYDQEMRKNNSPRPGPISEWPIQKIPYDLIQGKKIRVKVIAQVHSRHKDNDGASFDNLTMNSEVVRFFDLEQSVPTEENITKSEMSGIKSDGTSGGPKSNGRYIVSNDMISNNGNGSDDTHQYFIYFSVYTK